MELIYILFEDRGVIITEMIENTVSILYNIYGGLDNDEADAFLFENLSLIIDIMDFL
jgi:hypothetical protein